MKKVKELPPLEVQLQLCVGEKYALENTIRWLREQLVVTNANIADIKRELKQQAK